VQCGKVGQYFLYFASIVSSTLLPFFAEQKMAKNFADWKTMMRPYVLLMVIGVILIAAVGKLAFPFIFGVSFNQMHALMLVLLPGYFCLGMLTLVNVIYLANKNIKRIVIGDTIGLFMVIVFDAVFIPQYGVYAAAIISSIVYCIVFLIVWLGAKKQFQS
jgi:O-antigen/teichoic acid export membrane protein